MANRKAAEEIIIKYIEKITKCKDTVALYQDLFKSMSNKDFDDFMNDLKEKRTVLQVFSPPGSKNHISLENNMKIAEELGKSFFQHLIYEETDDTPAYISRVPYLVIKLPIYRVSQLLKKKISFCEDSKTIDNRTGQVTGKSRSASLTNPEISMLSAYGFNDLLTEMIKFRGGDQGGRQAMSKIMYSKGSVSLKDVEPYSTGVKSNQVLEQIYLGMGIRATVNKGRR